MRSHCLLGRTCKHAGDGEAAARPKDADARGLEGAERRGFMSNCVKPDRVKEETPHRKLEGEELRKFVAGCLDASAAAGG